MSKTSGKKGENIAKEFLLKKGIEIIEENYQYRKGEIDLIGLIENKTLLFVEVKMRSGNSFGYPEEFVSDYQRRLIIETADHYIHKINWLKDIRFDIVAIEENPFCINHFEDAFY